jgi:hypothetical protein
MARYTITNFSRGEFAPELYGRVDVPQYTAGAKELKNFIIQRYGGAAFRPGFLFVGEADDVEEQYRYMPFQFSVDQAYVEVLGDYSLRLLADGGYVTEDDMLITGITQEAQAVVTAAFHDLDIGDRVYIDGIGGMLRINGRFAEVVGIIDADNFRIDVDTSGFDAFTSSTGVARSAPPAAPAAPPAPEPAPPAAPPPPTTTTPNPGTGSGTGTGTYGPGEGHYRDPTGTMLQ